MLLLGGGVWQANGFFELGIGVPRDFTAENWAETAPEDRHFLLPSLQETVELAGMAEADVRALLGEPDFASNDTQMSYIVDSDWLDYIVLEFKMENGIVISEETKIQS